MAPRLKISGIYDLRTLKFLKEKGLGIFAFDFDPKSFNFLPGHVLTDMLDGQYSPLDSYSLIFNNSSLLNMENTVSDFLHATKQSRETISNLCLEVPESDLEVASKIGLPIKIKITEPVELNHFLTQSFFKGFILDYEALEIERDQAKAFHFLTSLFLLKERHGFSVDLKVPWEGGISSSLFDFYPFDNIELTINRKVEVCYRNVNLTLLEKEMGHLSQNF